MENKNIVTKRNILETVFQFNARLTGPDKGIYEVKYETEANLQYSALDFDVCCAKPDICPNIPVTPPSISNGDRVCMMLTRYINPGKFETWPSEALSETLGDT